VCVCVYICSRVREWDGDLWILRGLRFDWVTLCLAILVLLPLLSCVDEFYAFLSMGWNIIGCGMYTVKTG